MKTRWIQFVLLMGLGGCDFLGPSDDDRAGLRILALQQAVPAGGVQGIRTENRANRSIFFNPCPRLFERRIGGTWVPLPETRPEACTEHLEELPAGANGGFVTPVPDALGAGTYRVVFEGFWFRELDPPETQVIAFDLLPLEERTTGGFEVVVALPALSTPR